MILKKGIKLTIKDKNLIVKDELGQGGQGAVYLVNDGQKDYALKIYKEEPSKEFKANLRNNVLRGAPSSSFLWPIECIESKDIGFGYLMDVRKSNFVSFISYLNGKNNFKSKRIMLNWCIELVKSFKILHEKGFSYQDINDGSFFLDPDNGELLICDNDNVTVDKTNLGILGKMRYMAPEIVRGDKNSITKERQMPDTHSDRFSLAVILFLTLCLGDPFEGEVIKKFNVKDEKADYEIYGNNPVYIYNRNNSSNRPIRGYHKMVLKRYPLLPDYIKEAFHHTFVEGLKDRENGRTTEIEWLKLLSRFRDELVTCNNCGGSYYYGFYTKLNASCLLCKTPTKKACCLVINRNKILLEPGKSIYKIHLDRGSDEYNTEVGTVIKNKNNPSLFGIKLNIDHDVLIKDAKGNEMAIDKNGVIPIIKGLKIKFSDNYIGQIFEL